MSWSPDSAPPRRLALLLPDLSGGGAERVTLNLGAALAERGYQVDLVVARAVGPLELPKGLTLHDLGARRVATSWASLHRYLTRFRPDAIVSCLPHQSVIAVVAAKASRTPILVVQHNMIETNAYGSGRRRDRVTARLCRLSYVRADAIAAVSHGVATNLATVLGRPTRSIQVLHNPIDYEKIFALSTQPATHEWLTDRRAPVAVAVGRLVPQKDYTTLLDAVAQSSSKTRVLILGDGPQRAELAAQIGARGLQDRVELLGFVENPYPFLAAADAVVLSSRWEGLPTVLLEALRFPVSIVATDCDSGPREILAEGRYGRLVPVGDAPRLAEAIDEAVAETAVADVDSRWLRFDADAAVDAYESTLSQLWAGPT